MPDSKKQDTSEEEDAKAERPGTESEAPAEEPKTSTNADTTPEETTPDLVPESGASATSNDEKVIEPPDPAEQPSEDDVTPFDDDKTDEVINEIVAKEGDDLLAAQDAAAGKSSVRAPRPRSGGFWRRKWLRSLLLLLILGGIVAAGVIPKSRYFVLNEAGVRSTSSLVIIDSTTQLPLKGVNVSLAGQKVETDSDGKAGFTQLRLGPAKMSVEQAGFGTITRTVVIGWGSNPLGTLALQATGVQYAIEVQDYLSEKPIEGVEATDGRVTAISAKDGKITLTLANTALAKSGVTLSKEGYRTQTISLEENTKIATKAVLVPSRKAVFVVKQNGKYDVLKSDLDGQNREILLAGTGTETSNISLVVSPDGNRAALVSTRDGKHDTDGSLLSSLVLLNIATGDKLTIAQSAQIQLIDWIGPRLVYQAVSAGGETNRYAVTSYNYADNTRLQLAAANNLAAVISARGAIYYAVGADAASPSLQLGLFKIGADGNGKQRLIDSEVSTVLRSAYNTLNVQTADGSWYVCDLAAGSKNQVDTPASLANRLYLDNGDHSLSLWINQGALTSYEVATNKDTVVKTQSGITYPLEWIGPATALYRLAAGGETAEYAVSLLGGSAHKVADVATTYGFAQSQ